MTLTLTVPGVVITSVIITILSMYWLGKFCRNIQAGTENWADFMVVVTCLTGMILNLLFFAS